MTRISVAQRWGESFDVHVRGHRLVVDEPVVHGGDDDGPTPAELMVAALAASVAEAVQHHLGGAGVATQPVRVEADFAWADDAAEVTAIRLHLEVPPGLTPAQRDGAVSAAEACPVWRALHEPPEVELLVVEAAPAGR